MSSRFKVWDDQLPHFVTSTVVGWVDALSRETYKEIVCKSLKFCIEQKGMLLHAWVIMPNHIHLIFSCKQGATVSGIMRDLKKYTSRQIVTAILENEHESRKDWMLNMFRFTAVTNGGADEFQFWQNEFHPITLDNADKTQTRLNYLHENPVRVGIVWNPEDYKYSSAIDYYSKHKGILPVVLLG